MKQVSPMKDFWNEYTKYVARLYGIYGSAGRTVRHHDANVTSPEGQPGSTPGHSENPFTTPLCAGAIADRYIRYNNGANWTSGVCSQNDGTPLFEPCEGDCCDAGEGVDRDPWIWDFSD